MDEERRSIRADSIHRLATNLNRIREAAKMTPQELDEQCGFEPGYINAVEAEQISVTLAVIERMADELGCTLSALCQRLQL